MHLLLIIIITRKKSTSYFQNVRNTREGMSYITKEKLNYIYWKCMEWRKNNKIKRNIKKKKCKYEGDKVIYEWILLYTISLAYVLIVIVWLCMSTTCIFIFVSFYTTSGNIFLHAYNRIFFDEVFKKKIFAPHNPKLL